MKKLCFIILYQGLLLYFLYLLSFSLLYLDYGMLSVWGLLFLLPLMLFIIKRIKYKQKPIRQARIKRRKKYPLIVCFLGIFLLSIAYLTSSLVRKPEIPQSLLRLQEKYPEAKSYVKNYPKYKEKSFPIHLSEEINPNSIPLFSQRDTRWGYETYGDDLMGVTGCGPTSLSMVACALRQDDVWNPLKVAQMAEEKNYYIDGIGSSWELMTLGSQELDIQAEIGEISLDYILKNLSSSTPMICSVKPGDFTFTGHFIVLAGLDDSGKIIVNDPNSQKNSKKHWEIDRLLPKIKAIWKYSKIS